MLTATGSDILRSFARLTQGGDSASLNSTQVSTSLSHVAAEISRLHKMSNLIRRSSKGVQDIKANDFPIEDDEGNDLTATLLGHFKHHVRDRFPGLSDGILERLANSMLLRRKRILYRKSRQPKRTYKSETLVSGEAVMLPKAPSGVNTLPVKESSASIPDLPGMRMIGPSVVNSQTKTATTLAPDTFQKVSSTPSFISHTKTVAFGNHEALIFPPAPGNRVRRNYERLKAERHTTRQAALESLPGYQLYQEHDGEPPMDPHAVSLLEEQISTAQASMESTLKTDLQAIGEITCPYCFHAFPAQDIFDDRKWQYVFNRAR